MARGAVAAAFLAVRLVAQATPVAHVALGFGVDTARTPNREIFALYEHYLGHRLDPGRPNADWSAREQQSWPVFDLASGYLYQGFSNFTVVQLTPAVGFDSTYLIRVLISSVDSSQAVRPLALYRIYAVREEGRWVLANALPRMTRAWPHATIGSVTFHYPPTHAFASARAAATAQFADSLARAFAVPNPGIEYYFTDDLIEMFRALGLEYFPIGQDTVGGRSNTVDRQVYVGSSAAGETYRHEVAHVVLQTLVERWHPQGILLEGLMTWTGGSAGLDFRSLLPGLASFLEQHPEVTLDTVLRHPPPRDGTLDVGYDGAAVLCAMAYEFAGRQGIDAVLGAGGDPDQVLGALARVLGVPRRDLDRRWRAWIETHTHRE